MPCVLGLSHMPSHACTSIAWHDLRMWPAPDVMNMGTTCHLPLVTSNQPQRDTYVIHMREPGLQLGGMHRRKHHDDIQHTMSHEYPNIHTCAHTSTLRCIIPLGLGRDWFNVEIAARRVSISSSMREWPIRCLTCYAAGV